MTTLPHVLDVTSSLMQARWVFPAVDEQEVSRLIQRHGVPDVVARLLSSRGVGVEGVEAFLSPRLGRDFPDPFSLKGMEAAAEDIARAVMDRRRIALFCDFDVDGATSAAVLARFLRHLGQEPLLYVPDRLTEGYGPNAAALASLKRGGADLVLMADCGTTAHGVIAEGRSMGLEIIILDHHEAAATLPEASHLINPKQPGDVSGLSMLAACGVAFMTGVAVNAVLRREGFFAREGISEPPLKNWLDIVALGTVCDMVPLLGVNRLFVRAGFARMAQLETVGIRALCEFAKLSGAPTPYHAGFALGPRINAGSRVHQADLGARLLSTDDLNEALQIASVLEECNVLRKDIQAAMMEEAIGKVEALGLSDAPCIVVDDPGWHPGLAGLVAGRLKEKYHRPACVVSYAVGADGEPEGRGSGRSVPGVNIAAAFQAAEAAGLLIKGGGHAMAGGFTIRPDLIPEFRRFVMDHVVGQLNGAPLTVETVIDGVMSLRGARVDLVRCLQDQVGPFGQGHAEPVFAFPSVRVHQADVLGDGHVRCLVSDWEGGARIKAMAFRSADTPLGKALLSGPRGGMPIHLAGSLKVDSWGGQERVELHISDAAHPVPGAGAKNPVAAA